jgi:hypothetical protein
MTTRPSSVQSAVPGLAVKVVQGRVSLHRTSGVYLRTLCSGAASAVVQGNEVHVANPDGKVRIYDVNGTYRRTL